MNIKSISTSELRNNLRKSFEYVRVEQKPLLITEHGEVTTVVLDIATYSELLIHTKNPLSQKVKELCVEYAKKKQYGTMYDLF